MNLHFCSWSSSEELDRNNKNHNPIKSDSSISGNNGYFNNINEITNEENARDKTLLRNLADTIKNQDGRSAHESFKFPVGVKADFFVYEDRNILKPAIYTNGVIETVHSPIIEYDKGIEKDEAFCISKSHLSTGSDDINTLTIHTQRSGADEHQPHPENGSDAEFGRGILSIYCPGQSESRASVYGSPNEEKENYTQEETPISETQSCQISTHNSSHIKANLPLSSSEKRQWSSPSLDDTIDSRDKDMPLANVEKTICSTSKNLCNQGSTEYSDFHQTDIARCIRSELRQTTSLPHVIPSIVSPCPYSLRHHLPAETTTSVCKGRQLWTYPTNRLLEPLDGITSGYSKCPSSGYHPCRLYHRHNHPHHRYHPSHHRHYPLQNHHQQQQQPPQQFLPRNTKAVRAQTRSSPLQFRGNQNERKSEPEKVAYVRTRRKFSPISAYSFLCILGLYLMTSATVKAQGLTGTLPTCANENEMVSVPGITDKGCITCVCKGGQVKCKKKSCLNLEGCHAILHDQPSDMCCDVCKGCRYKGALYKSGDQWRDKKKPCLTLSCRAGVVTRSKIRCFNHCYNTVPVEGQCCPACPGCYWRGRTYQEGDKFQLPTDICTTCVCKNNSISCERRQCPVLNCPPGVIYQPENECCPKCRGSRRVFDVKSGCYFAKKIKRRGEKFRPNKCSRCTCKAETSVCIRQTCPAQDCKPEDLLPASGSACCRRCKQKKHCVFDEKTYKHQEEWKPNVCMHCTCDDGVSYCQRERCSNSLWCPQGYRLLLNPDQCCPKCVEHDALCSVFGDPHYRTFDGLMYSFQGTCKYILARDCTKNEFLIKVRNGVRFSSGFAWTQMLVVFVYQHRISMLQNSVVKVNRKRVRPPYSKPGMFSISEDGDLIHLKTELGLHVTWDGDSFLEVTVSTKFKYRMCGLCGNYNGVKSDDLIGRDGVIYPNGGEYGHSWRVGSKRACQVRPRFQETEPLCEKDPRAKRRAHRLCSVFFSRVFAKCRPKIKVDVYVSSCITDMCDCPEGRNCACEAIRAYVSQCVRSGVKVLTEKLRGCPSLPEECPRDTTRIRCDIECPRKCGHPGSLQNTGPCPERCVEACQCPAGQVMQRGECIPSSQCNPPT